MRQLDPLLLICALLVAACGDTRSTFAHSTKAELEKTYPDASLCYSHYGFQRNAQPYFPFIADDAQFVGIGYETNVVNPDNPDGPGIAPKVGRWIYHYDDRKGPRLAIGENDMDKHVGPWQFWHRNGSVRAKGTFTAGKLHGEWRIWRKDGKVDPGFTGVYEDGKRTGDLPQKH
ncbi:MAG: hypothetical protein ACI89X_004364 [Planctomycetota bacterium]|jgi:hypothetical protein